MLVVANKIDAAQDHAATVETGLVPSRGKKKAVSKKKPTEPAKLAALRAFAKKKKLPFYAISAVTGEGVDPLKYAMWEQVQTLRKKEATAAAADDTGFAVVTPGPRRRRPRDWRK
jgi:50S ribosomal subunit-associated GTPase HflX